MPHSSPQSTPPNLPSPALAALLFFAVCIAFLVLPAALHLGGAK